MGKQFKKNDDLRGSKKSFRELKESRVDSRQPSKLCLNDPSWYTVNDTLLKSVASLSFPQWLGGGINLDEPTLPYEGLITRIPFYPSVGQSRSGDSGINMAARNMYVLVRHANSGHTNYESPDMCIYTLSVGYTIAFAAHLERILGIAKYFKARNGAVPNRLLQALGVTDPQNLIRNLANYTAMLNEAWAKIASLCLPTDMKFIKRWIWMCSQVFKDHESDKAAMYVFVPAHSCRYRPTALATGGSFFVGSDVSNDFDDTIANLYSALDAMISNIVSDEDMRIMSGDILKAFGSDKLLKFGSTSLDYQIQPVFVEEMLPQIHNLRTGFGSMTSNGWTFANYFSNLPRNIAVTMSPTDATALATALGGKAYIYQVNGDIIESNCFTYASAATIDANNGASYYYDATTYDKGSRPGHELILNSFKLDPDEKDVIVATRLQFTYGRDTTLSQYDFHIEQSGTEIVPHVFIYACGPKGTPTVTLPVTTDIAYYWSNVPLSYATAIEVATQFDWFPIIYRLHRPQTGGSEASVPVRGLCGDLDNFTIVADDRLASMHRTAALAEFSVTALNYLEVK